jgi:hypothetical protein
LNKKFAYGFAVLALTFLTSGLHAQTDTLPPRSDSVAFRDTARKIPADSLPLIAPPVSNVKKADSVMKVHSPRKAALRSAIIPGWGQIYNKKYWKLPIVYGALGVSGGIFIYYLQTYREVKLAYAGRVEAVPKRDPNNPSVFLPADSTKYNKIKNPFYKSVDINALRSYRDDYRRNIDYSALAFIVLWGLQVVDATVDAHLKTFDVSPDLSFKVKFGHSQFAGTNGISLVLALK